MAGVCILHFPPTAGQHTTQQILTVGASQIFTKMLPICKGPAQGQNIQRLCGEDVTGTQRAQQHVLRVMNSLFSFMPLKNTHVVETIINYPFGNGLYHLFVVIWGMVYYCFNHIIPTCMFILLFVGSIEHCHTLRLSQPMAGFMPGRYGESTPSKPTPE